MYGVKDANDTAHSSGWKAHNELRKKDSNPHKIPALRDAWDKGWQDSHNHLVGKWHFCKACEMMTANKE